LRRLAKISVDSQRIEIDLHVRGRDHTYVLKPVPLRQTDGESLGTIVIFQDITYLRDKDRARVNLVATLSHELRTPLTSLRVSAELLERRGKDNLDAKQQELLAAIIEDIGRIQRMSDDLLDLARGATGMIPMRHVEIDLGQLIRLVAKQFRLQADEKHVTLAVNVAEPNPTIHGDPVKLFWAVSNLVANALRYTPDNGTIFISSNLGSDGAQVKVRDTGPGIATEIRNHLFERFSQWTINGSAPGSSGLGLAIVKEIVEGHGGRIFVDSTLGTGTCFTLQLPI
jgi:signal transduction histidine kinase